MVGDAESGQVWLTSSLGARLWLRSCDRVGPNTRTFWRPNIENRGRIVLGARVRLNSNWAPIELVSGPAGVIDIGDGVFINYGSMISAHLRVRIGSERDGRQLLHRRRHRDSGHR